MKTGLLSLSHDGAKKRIPPVYFWKEMTEAARCLIIHWVSQRGQGQRGWHLLTSELCLPKSSIPIYTNLYIAQSAAAIFHPFRNTAFER